MRCSAIFLILILSSCVANAGTGAITGSILGGTIGIAFGGNKGAFIAAPTGAILGALIGAILDEQDRRIMEHKSPRTVSRMDRGDPLTINDVIKLSQGGVSDDTIIRYLQSNSSSYSLSQAQIRRLQEGGVSSRVIQEMMASGKS